MVAKYICRFLLTAPWEQLEGFMKCFYEGRSGCLGRALPRRPKGLIQFPKSTFSHHRYCKWKIKYGYWSTGGSTERDEKSSLVHMYLYSVYSDPILIILALISHWLESNWACISFAEGKTLSKQAGTNYSCNKGLLRHHHGRNPALGDVYKFQTAGIQSLTFSLFKYFSATKNGVYQQKGL